MAESRWTNALLDEMRTIGDPTADAVVERLFAEGKVDAVNRMMRALVENDEIPTAQLPDYVGAYLAEVAAVDPLLDMELVRQGEKIFERNGPEVIMALGFYSLPASYAARKGVQVLYRTGYLLNRPMRRVFETAQLVVDVMSPGGLQRGGKGVRTVQKVRLMHAAVRLQVRNDPNLPWDPSFGVPVNQEDLAGTLTTFSIVVMEGLDTLKLPLTPDEQKAWLHAWLAVGRMLGIDPRVLPTDVADAHDLTNTIRARQIAESPEGQAMTRALIEGYAAILPRLMRDLPASMIHFFLDNDRFNGQDVPKMLGVPKANWTEHIASVATLMGGLFNRLDASSRDADGLMRSLSLHFMEALLLVQRGGTRAPFTIPDSLYAGWKARGHLGPRWL